MHDASVKGRSEVGGASRRNGPSRVATTDLRPDEIPKFCVLCTLLNAAALRVREAGSAAYPVRRGAGPYRNGEVIFRDGAPVDALYVIRSGLVETRKLDAEGHSQVLGFHLPGEVIGLDSMSVGRASCDALAIDTTFLCRITGDTIKALAANDTAVQNYLLRLLSLKLHVRNRLTRDSSSVDGRMAAFLLHLGQRYARCGFSRERFPMRMQERDIASYLRMAPETASRALHGFLAAGLIAIEKRLVTLRQTARLETIARRLLQ